jgi:tRNA(Ile)-lysidine synthase
VQVKVAPEYQDRFRRALDRLGVSEDERIMLAVSGGPDSLALLVMASQTIPERISAATVDHRLRLESADEASYVREICNQHGVAHCTLIPTEPITGNIQASARAARYALLDEAADENKCSLVATAHHADDQLETLLMRLARGSGVGGMAGIRARNGRVIRPLLDFAKSELEEICATANAPPIRDPSNDNPDFHRVAMRQWLARSGHRFDRQATNRTAAALADADTALDWMTEQLSEQRLKSDNGKISLDTKDLPKEIQRRLLLLALQLINPKIVPRGEAVERLMADLKVGKTATISDILCRGGKIWHFSPAPPRRTQT